MADGGTSEYEWNARRKLWHLAGCVLMILAFWLWKDIYRPVRGLDVLVVFGWALVSVSFGIDLMRFYSPHLNRAVANLPFYGKLMRRIEHDHFNATTYYLTAASILVTACRLGWCRDTTMIMALAVLGFADPAAAWVRYQLAKRGWGNERAFGLLVFCLASVLVLWASSELLDCHLHVEYILAIGMIVALVESYTKYWVHALHPVTHQFQKMVFHRGTVWLFRLYPDDNLLIPLLVAALIGVL